MFVCYAYGEVDNVYDIGALSLFQLAKMLPKSTRVSTVSLWLNVPLLSLYKDLVLCENQIFLSDCGLAESQLLTEGLINYSNLTFDLTLIQQRSEI